MTVTLTTSALAAPISLSFAVTASATSTVFALDVLVTVRVSEGTPSVRAKPVVGTPAWTTVAMSFEERPGVGATGGVGAAPGLRRPAPLPGTRRCRCRAAPAVLTPTTRFSIWAIEVNEPIVETGTFVRRRLDLARGQGEVVGRQDAVDLGDRDAGRGELRRVEGDHDLGLEAAGQVDRRDAVDALEGGHDLRPRHLGRGVQAVLAGAGDRRDDHRRGVDVERRDLRRDAVRAGRPAGGSARSWTGLP